MLKSDKLLDEVLEIRMGPVLFGDDLRNHDLHFPPPAAPIGKPFDQRRDGRDMARARARARARAKAAITSEPNHCIQI